MADEIDEVITTVNNKQIDINNTIGMKLDANQAKLYSTKGSVPIYAECGDKKIILIDENGNTYLKTLTVDGKNINEISNELSEILNVLRGATWSKTFAVGESGNKPGNDTVQFAFAIPFKGVNYKIIVSEMTDSLKGDAQSPVGWGTNGVTIGYTDNKGSYITKKFTTDTEDYGPIVICSDLTVILDTQETITGRNFNRFGSFYYQGGSCRITLKLSI